MKCKDKLTDKQELFIQELVLGKSQREAYKVVYPNSLKWKDKTIDEAASRLFNQTKVYARFKELNQKAIDSIESKTIVTKEQIVAELVKIAFGNGSDYSRVVEREHREPIKDDDGEIIDYQISKYKVVEFEETDSLSENKKAALSCIKETKFGLSVERYDKLKALELLGKHLGMFEKEDKDNTQTINVIHNIPRPPKGGEEE